MEKWKWLFSYKGMKLVSYVTVEKLPLVFSVNFC